MRRSSPPRSCTRSVGANAQVGGTSRPQRAKSHSAPPPRLAGDRNRPLLLGAVAGALAVAVVAALALGAVPIPVVDVVKVLGMVGRRSAPGSELRQAWSIITLIRLPRVVAALVAGAALAVSGAAMQGLFRNPMAGPDVLGISAGASLGAVVAIAAGLALTAPWIIPIAAFIGSVTTALVVYVIATRTGVTHLLYIVLAGLAISSVVNGAVSAVLMIAEEYAVSQFIFWTMGGLEGSAWSRVVPPTPVVIALTILLVALSTPLNLLSLGEEQAHSLGVPVQRLKLLILVVSATLTAMAIAIAGPIAFVGLMVPHLVRILVGPDHRIVIPASALGGAAFLVAADTVARTILAPREIETGIVTALLGGPYFLVLIVRAQRGGGR